jgi:hypothetical protein
MQKTFPGSFELENFAKGKITDAHFLVVIQLQKI